MIHYFLCFVNLFALIVKLRLFSQQQKSAFGIFCAKSTRINTKSLIFPDIQRKSRPKSSDGFINKRLFGRRAILLHLSGFPCQYHRRVVDAKFTTSNNLFLF